MMPILPGATIGILGSGQLGRMLAFEARRLGYFVHVYSPERNSPTGQVADLEITAPYNDEEALRRFAQQVAVVTFEFENVPSSTIEVIAAETVVHPAGAVLHTTQNRAREKAWLMAHGFPVAPFALIQSLPDLEAALEQIGTPAILKTAAFGYDGKGQVNLAAPTAAVSAWQAIGQQEAVLEGYVTFVVELSVIVARNAAGQIACYSVTENYHRHHILDLSVAPARIPPALAVTAQTLAAEIVAHFAYVGVMGVELFVTHEGRLLVNELAPRPHNSGHWTFGGAATSQFEQQLRAICGLPLGEITPHTPGVAMANLLGDLWAPHPPDWPVALRQPGVALHLYGKQTARPGRKMGHLTALATTPAQAAHRALVARAALTHDDNTDIFLPPKLW